MRGDELGVDCGNGRSIKITCELSLCHTGLVQFL